jgi:hypothetical protein
MHVLETETVFTDLEAIIAVKETAKLKALELIAGSCADAKMAVTCPHCSLRYLLLLDMSVCGDDKHTVNLPASMIANLKEILGYAHADGHKADYIATPLMVPIGASICDGHHITL